MRFLRGKIAVFATALLTLAMAGTATAATYTPTTFGDEDGAATDCPADGNAGGCSLREAIKAANESSADDTVALGAGTYEIQSGLGDLDVADNGKLLIRGAGARSTTIDGNDGTRLFTFQAGSEADVQELRLTDGFQGNGEGGAVRVLDGQEGDAVVRFARVRIDSSEAGEGWGGAIYNYGDVTLTESLVAANEAGGHGGGIYNDDELTLVNSTISGNESGFNGGGIHNTGFSREENEDAGVFVENSTISANKAPNGNGGGIFTGPPEFGEEECGFCEASARVVAFTLFASASFHNAIVSGNTASGEANCSGNQPKESPSPSSRGYNIEDGETCEFKSTGDKDDDPQLADLADNGGQTDTHALKEGSPAIDAGDPDANKCEDIDQRGVTRFQRNGCDIGAYEAGEVPQPPNDIPTSEQTPRGEPEVRDTCSDRLPPLTTLRASGLTVDSDSVTLVGRSRDRGDPCPSGVQRVEVSMAKVSGTDLNCRFVRSSNRFVITPFRNCRRPILFVARGTRSWRFVFRGVLPPGKYRAQARGYDNARNKETPKKRRNIIVFDVP